MGESFYDAYIEYMKRKLDAAMMIACGNTTDGIVPETEPRSKAIRDQQRLAVEFLLYDLERGLK